MVNPNRYTNNYMGSYGYPVNTELTIAQTPLNYNNDGWSVQDSMSTLANPAKHFQQSQINIYDSQPAKLTDASLSPILDSYGIGSTKGNSAISNKLIGTNHSTKK